MYNPLLRLTSIVLISVSTLVGAETKVIKAVAPSTYPASALADGVSGKIEVDVEIGKNGEVTSVISTRCKERAKPLLAEAIACAKKWRFKPEGKSNITLVFQFKLISKNNETDESGIEFLFPYTIHIYEYSQGIEAVGDVVPAATK